MAGKTSNLQVLSLFDYKPAQDEEIPTSSTTEASSKTLTVCKGQRFEVLNDEIDWWLLVRSLATQEEGFIPSTCVAPLRRDLTDEQLLALDDEKLLCPSMVNCDVDMKYFPDAPHEKHVLKRRTCPEQETNIFSRLTFWWLTGLIITGYKRPLQDSDLWELSTSSKSSTIIPRLQQEWNKELKAQQLKKEQKIKNGPRAECSETSQLKQVEGDVSYISGKKEHKPSLVKAMIRVYGPYFAIAVVFKLINDTMLFVQPYLLRLLIQYTEDKGNNDIWKGYVYTICMVVVAIVQLTALQQYFHIAYSTGMRIRSGVLGIVYAKAIKLSSSARRETTAGEMVNLMSVDAQRLMELMTNLNLMWSAPLQITGAMYFLYNVMDVATLAGVAVLLLMIPLNLVVTKLCRRLQVKQMRHKDERTKIINEVLSGMKVLKLYAWEESFMRKIAAVREEELKYLTWSNYLHWGFSFIFTCTPFLVSMATFAVYVMLGNELTATKAFVAVALFNVLRFPITTMPRVIMNFVQAQVSVKRLSDFLSQDEIDPGGVIHSMPAHIRTQSVHVNEGTFSWDEKSDPVLKSINLQIKRGSLLGIVGPVGCGKSTLLSALLGETHKVSGEVYVEGKTAYISQLAWIQNATLRDNVLFGRGFDYRKYHQILHSCALKPDIAVLPTGDLTEIGEKGINLSGGQKQRVSLARAVYFDADVYLLDDPLSAVDAHVGRHIFNKVIGSEGLLKDKTRILVTHQTQFLPQMDHIIYLQDGRISEAGTYTELMANEGLFAEYVKTHRADENNQDSTADRVFDKAKKAVDGDETFMEDKKKKSFSCELLNGNSVPVLHRVKRNSASCKALNRYSKLEREDSTSSTDHKKPVLPRNISRASIISIDSILCDPRDLDCQIEEVGEEDISNEQLKEQSEVKLVDDKPKTDFGINAGGNLITKETSQTGKVRFTVFMAYARSLGILCFILVLLFAISAEGFLISSRVWLADWSTTNITSTNQRDIYLGIYGVLGIGQAVGTLLYQIVMAYAGMKAARNLHHKLLVNIMHSPMTFFETTPLGRIINRFSKDINAIDDTIPRTIIMFLRSCFTVVGTISVICYSTPLFLTCILPLGVLYICFQRVYVATSRQLKRIESVSRSPVYNHFLETINGTSTVRAYSQQNRFIQENYRRIDQNMMACYPSLTVNRWLAVRLEFIASIILLFAALFSVISRQSVSSGLVGLSITYALQVTGSLNWVVRQTSDLETNIVSVERVKEYCETPQEADWIIETNRPPNNWPQEGKIQFDEFNIRYREELPMALEDVTFDVKGGEKIGIVGRTGAGKTSLSVALFRILESARGKIVIDNIDISTIGLQDLRSRLAIIPQDPVLFSGSLRMNLDPFSIHSDDKLWRVLEVSQLKSFVSELPDGLSHHISEGGENLSMGQRQLVCLARALLRKSKILVLDEATAAVDLETDEFIQKTIRREFADRTVLTIAHRLNTIIDCSRILVLDKGRVAEFDTPANLQARRGIFHSMACSAGLSKLPS